MSDYAVDMSQWERFFRESAARMQDLTPVHQKIGAYLVTHAKNNFNTGGGADRWEPLKPSTLTAERLRYGRRPLMKTLALVKSMTFDAQRRWCDIGSALKQARALFFGYPPNNLPARHPFAFLAGVLEPIGDMYAAFVMGVH